MTTPHQPGWYDDPQNSNAQRYFDGQNWTPHRQRKNTPPTESQPTPTTPPPTASTTHSDGLGPSRDTVRPHAAQAQQLWSRLSRQNKIASAVVLVVIVIVVAFGAHLFGSTDGAGGSTAVDTSSQSYQMGLATGTNGQAEIAAYGGFDILTHSYRKLSPHDACEGQWNLDNGAEPDLHLSKKDYMAGCLYGIDHNADSTNASHEPAATVAPPSKKGPNGSTIPNRPGS